MREAWSTCRRQFPLLKFQTDRDPSLRAVNSRRYVGSKVIVVSSSSTYSAAWLALNSITFSPVITSQTHTSARWSAVTIYHHVTRQQIVQTSAKASNIDQTLSGIRIPTSGLIRIRIRMSAGLLPKCCGHQSLRRVSWKSAGDCMRNANKSPETLIPQWWGKW